MNAATRKMPSSVARSNKNSFAVAAAVSASPAVIGAVRRSRVARRSA